MARIKYSALVESIAGSIGGTTFQRNAYGFTVKKKPNIVNPNYASQQVFKQRMLSLSHQWQTLTATERGYFENWSALYPIPARLNQDAYLGGQQIFMKVNLIAAQLDKIVFQPSAVPQTLPYQLTALYMDGPDLRVELTMDSAVNDIWCVLYMLPRLTATQNTTRNRTRFVTIASNFLDTDVLDTEVTGFQQKFGFQPVAGDQIFVKWAFFQLLAKTFMQTPVELLTVG